MRAILLAACAVHPGPPLVLGKKVARTRSTPTAPDGAPGRPAPAAGEDARPREAAGAAVSPCEIKLDLTPS